MTVKVIRCLLIILVAWVVTIPSPAHAQPDSPGAQTGERAAGAVIYDEAGVLDPGNVGAWEAKIAHLEEAYRQGVAVFVVNGLGGQTPRSFADDCWDYGRFGYADGSGIGLLISVTEREVYMTTTGTSIRTFSDYGIERILDSLVVPLGRDDWNAAVDVFLERVEQYMAEAASGQPFDVDNTPPLTGQERITKRNQGLAISGLGGLVVGGAVAFFRRRRHNTARAQVDADSYVAPGSFQLHRRNDVVVARNVTVTQIESSSSGGGGGSSTHTGSSGVSHGGGGRSF